MALIHKIRYSSTDISLIDADAISVTDTFVPAAIDMLPGDGTISAYVVEALPVRIHATSEDALAATLQGLHYAQRLAAEYWVDSQQTTPVWYHQKQDNETGERRALVKSIRFIPAESYMTPPASFDALEGTIIIERHPYWERTISRAFPIDSTVTAGVVTTYDYTGYGANLVSNVGFETAGGGGADIWANWTETAGDGALADEGAIVQAGSHAAKITGGATSGTYISQSITVEPNQTYLFNFYTRGDGTNAGRYGVYDGTNAAWIRTAVTTGVAGTTYTFVSYAFTAPATCVTASLYLLCPTANGGVAYFDTVYCYLNNHDIVGDVGARIEEFSVDPAAGDTLGRIWVGLRSANRHGTLANFVPTWECEAGTNNSNESGVTDDAATDPNGASPGSAAGSFVKVVETDLQWDDTWQWVCLMTLDSVTANLADNYGQYLWLLRAMVTAGTWEIQLRYGTSLMAEADLYQGQIIEISSTNWNIYAADVQNIPMQNRQATNVTSMAATLEETYAVWIYAQRTSGAGNLYLDALYPIPVDEGFLFLSDFSTDAEQHAFTDPKDEILGISIDGTSVEDFPGVSSAKWSLPTGDGMMVIAWAREATSDFTDNLTAISSVSGGTRRGTYVERWVTLRGAE